MTSGVVIVVVGAGGRGEEWPLKVLIKYSEIEIIGHL
jgi:hypothetical protein